MLGVLILGSHLPLVLRGNPFASLVIGVSLPTSLGVVLIGVDYWVPVGRVTDSQDALRLAWWTILTALAVFLTDVWILVFDIMFGQPVPYGYLLTINIASLGGIGGVVIGLDDYQHHEYADAERVGSGTPAPE